MRGAVLTARAVASRPRGWSMRLLITSTAGTGHVHPLIPFALEARDRGHDVRWALAAVPRQTIERLGIRALPAGMSLAERNASFGERYGPALVALPPLQRRALAFTGHFAELSAPRMLDDLRAIVEGWQPDLVVHEAAELAGPIVAEALGVPHATVAFSGAIPDAAQSAAAKALAPLRATLALAPRGDLGLDRHAYFHPFPPSMGQRPHGAEIHDLRPVASEDPSSATPDWIASLGRDRPFVYVTFGTEMAALAPWSTLMPALLSLDDVDIVVTIGASLDPDVLGPLPPRLRVERYVPQESLLPSCSLVVSHAGAGTLLATAAHGIPQILLPIGADQFDNAAACVGTGAGVAASDLGSEALAAHARALLGDGEHRTAAHRLAEEIAEMPGPSRAVEVVEGLGDGREALP